MLKIERHMLKVILISFFAFFQSQARCLIGLYDSQSGPLDDQSENARFLVGCQSVKPNGSQVKICTCYLSSLLIVFNFI